MIERRLAKLGFAHDAAVGQPGRIPGSAAVGLLVAAAVLDDFSISATSFILDVVIFAVLQAVLSRLIPRHAVLGPSDWCRPWSSPSCLTYLFSDGVKIKGLATWVLATLIVWIVTTLATWALSRSLRRNRAASRRSQ